jgi:hypothetical protein
MFSLSSKQNEQTIRIETDEVSQDHLPGTYKGSIIFTFDYSKNN